MFQFPIQIHLKHLCAGIMLLKSQCIVLGDSLQSSPLIVSAKTLAYQGSLEYSDKSLASIAGMLNTRLVFFHAQGLHGGMWCYVDITSRTNVILYKPLPSQAVEIHLFDSDGRELTKTSYGRRCGHKLEPDAELLDPLHDPILGGIGYERLMNLMAGEGTQGEFIQFCVSKAFHIRKPGRYRLQVEARLFAKRPNEPFATNAVFIPIVLSPVEATVDILEADLSTPSSWMVYIAGSSLLIALFYLWRKRGKRIAPKVSINPG